MGRKPNKLKAANPFLEAIQFVGIALKEQGTPYECHLYLNNNWAIANNGVLAIGCPISWPNLATPNYSMFSNALIKCGVDWEIKSSDPLHDSPGNLHISQGKFHAIIPCCDPILITLPTIDPPIAAISNAFREALGKVAMLANDNAQSVIEASILMNGQSIVGTDRTIIIEAWHGCDLPPGLALPKAFAIALCKIVKNLKAFGYSDNSITIYFKDNSWIKSQLFNSEWPDVNTILNGPSNQQSIPTNLWNAIGAIENFSKNGLAYSRNGMLHSHDVDDIGASFECSSIPLNITFSIKYLKLIQPWAQNIDFFAYGPNGNNCIKAFGENTRAIIAGRM